jgi:hypothetical protein
VKASILCCPTRDAHSRGGYHRHWGSGSVRAFTEPRAIHSVAWRGCHTGSIFKLGDISFGDNVRIVVSELTTASGHADRVGVCYGMTTPSVTGVEVVGAAADDVALNVHFEDEAVDDAWFAPELVEVVDHAVGSQATVGDHAFVKAEDGTWAYEAAGPEPHRRGWFRRR